MTDEELFERAKSLRGEQQTEFLRANCTDDQQFVRVKELLGANDAADSLLDLPSTANVEADSTISINGQIGNYKLLQKIGEGGMGSVYMAEQLRPVKRMVALKLVKAGMDSKQVIARFEAERQSLAMMDHPNIAKVLDAGTTEKGEPYFVMELVKGVPIHEYCDQNRLSTDQRVKMMIDVCSAVQHAHQKGIIHRDLKPSNILVAQYDDRPVPKVIDFGVAKATHQKLTEKTLFTQLGQIVGTLEYMSPEQAVLNQLDVDTRTDVYSLGVVLYELLVGETPINGKELRSQGLEQILRTIREQEPARPSVRVSSQGQAANQMAAYRRTDQRTLSRKLSGDLDWIVMKSLEKDRTRRYESASRLAEDLKHFLAGETVEARPPTVAYRLQKSWQRNRVLLSSSTAVILALTIGFIGMWRENGKTQKALERVTEQRESKERLLQQNRKQSELLAAQLNRSENALSYVRDYCMLLAMTGDPKDRETALQIAVQTESTAAWKNLLEGQAECARGNHSKAIKHFKLALEEEPENIIAQSLLTIGYAILGDFDEFLNRSYGLTHSPLPSGLEERIYFAYGMVLDSKRAFELIDVVASQRNTPLASIVFADATAQYSLANRNPNTVAKAIELLEDVRGRIGENSMLSLVSLRLRHIALLNEELTTAQQDSHREQAAHDIEQLRRRPSNHIGQIHIASFLSDFAPEQSKAEWTAILNDPQARGSHAYAVRAMTLRENNLDGYEAAAGALKESTFSLSRMWYAYCLHRIGRGKEAEAEYQMFKKEGKNPLHNYLYYLSLTGPRQRLSHESRAFVKENKFSSPLVELTARYYVDPTFENETALRGGFAFGTPQWVTALGAIGRVRLLQYDEEGTEAARQSALDVVDEIINSRLISQGDYYWAKSMKVRLEASQAANGKKTP